MKGSQNILRVSHISLLFLDVANKHGRYHLAFAHLNAVKGYSTFEDLWRLFSSNCSGYRGQASICTYESTSIEGTRILHCYCGQLSSTWPDLA